jgi:hypothetical protein
VPAGNRSHPHGSICQSFDRGSPTGSIHSLRVASSFHQLPRDLPPPSTILPPGALGAFRMGLKHGGYCLGCCWALMGLLFAFGVMNLLWVAGLSAFVLLEKISPKTQLVSRLSGLLFIGWGAWMAVGQPS